MSSQKSPTKVYLKDYQQPEYFIPETQIRAQLFEDHALITSKYQVKKNKTTTLGTPLKLDGAETLELLSVSLNEEPLAEEKYKIIDQNLILSEVPDNFQLEVSVKIRPQDNKAFSGLYKTKSLFSTQMEAQGFRRMNYCLDRPDVLSVYTTRVEADVKYPHLLSNGNLVEQEALGENRHACVWKDPHPKPTYLFALVAGDFDVLEDTYKTSSGRPVQLEIFTDKGNKEKSHHAMKSLKESMKWDEDTYDCEYDLDKYMIVAVEDFNMGAMENKGLNIFNSRYVLADDQTATDLDFYSIQSIIGHEYFHNWSGNRITCRDWFQLSLKEGLTVFRDQEFSSDLNSRGVKRIDDVTSLRLRQFPEDSGGMAHPVRPPAYAAMDNFYTATVYLKGAEVIRMYQTLLGRETFLKGVKHYFKKHDGQAVTCDDFVAALEEDSGENLSQFKLWYSQTGTPTLHLTSQWSNGTMTLHLKQNTVHPVTKETNQPYHFPVKLALIHPENGPMALNESGDTEMTVAMKEAEQTLTFENIPEGALVSALRDFSAPVRLQQELSLKDQITLMSKDNDSFNRWEAGQNAFKTLLLGHYHGQTEDSSMGLLWNAINEACIAEESADLEFISKLLRLPEPTYVQQFLETVHPERLEQAYDWLYKNIQSQCGDQLITGYEKSLNWTPTASVRAFQQQLLKLLTWKNSSHLEKVYERFESAKNMTDSVNSLGLLIHHDHPLSQKASATFYEKWQANSLVMNKWFAIQASSMKTTTLTDLKNTAELDTFDKTNPNKLYSVYVAFGSNNLFRFHDSKGEGYEFVGKAVLETDARNPQVASRMTQVFSEWHRWEGDYRKAALSTLESIRKQPNLSSNVSEMIDGYLSQK